MQTSLPRSTSLNPAEGQQNYPLHLLLLLATLFCTTWAGTFWLGNPADADSGLEGFFRELQAGLPFSLSFVGFITVHEFGHYIAARRHHLNSTLPFYIPVPPLPFMLNIGTMGAVIKIRDPFPDGSALLGVGAAGPLAGFPIAVGLLVYGFLNMPPADYLTAIHPEYLATGAVHQPEHGEVFLGKNLLFILLEKTCSPRNMPPMTELYHYPFLFAGWLACLMTSLNLLPVGQLDGGHVAYALFGRDGHRWIAMTFIGVITCLGFPSLAAGIVELSLPDVMNPVPVDLLRWSWPGWILWALLLTRVIGISHPQVIRHATLSRPDRVAGWLCIVVFILTFTPIPFGIV